ncbi:unnamed protein product [Orchesella dallaii]|uniref:NACHT domain-containing protein n=1 Tax=Orchesella dallaii TaxID=48710 RepID=A0ABP1RA33_9HEXA
MDIWEKTCIKDNLDKLMENTVMSDLFVQKLNYILSDSDNEALKVIQTNKGASSSSMELYNIAKTRLNGYRTLIKGLLETNQTGALSILVEGFLSNKKEENIFKAYDINVRVDDPFLSVICNFQEAVLRCSVKFQGRTVLLKHVLKGLSVKTINGLVSTKLKGDLLVKLINGKEPSIFIDSVPEKLKYYISRKLSPRCNISARVFDKKCADIFVIDGIEQIQLREFAGKEGTDLSSNQIDDLSTRFIVLELEDDFDIICDKAKGVPVHLLKHEEGQFIWVRTHGAISSLQEYVDDSQTKFNEEQFTTTCVEHAYPVCVSDTPGMGKTMLMVSLAHYIMEKYPNRLVCFFILRDFLQHVNELQKESRQVDESFCKKLISEYASENEFGREVVVEFLKSPTPTVDLIFDGFDEVLPDDIETALKILKITSKLKSVTVYVSTRPHMRDELENSLGALGYNILAFNEHEQIEFLTKYWQEKSIQKYNTHDEKKLEKFASQCLDKLKQNMNDMEGGIAGIPLQCSLLAEVYENQAVRYSNPEKRKADHDKGMVINITSIFEMYKKLMENRFDKIMATETTKKRLVIAHIYHALKLLYPEYMDKFEDVLKERNEVKSQELLSLGILEKKTRDETPPKFVHRTFAEYFVGLFIVQMLTKQKTGEFMLDFFLNVALRTTKSMEHLLSSSNVGLAEPIESSYFENPVVCYFINAHLKNEDQPVEIEEVTWTRKYSKLYDVVAACITHEYPGLYSQAAESKVHKQLLAEDTQRLGSLVLIAAKYSNITLFRMVHKYVVEYLQNYFVESRAPNFVVTPLHVAVERGYYPIAEYLYSDNEANSGSQQTKYLLHCCVAGSIRDTDATLSQKLEIIKLLCSKNGTKTINESTPDGTTPLLTSNIHMKLFTSLLESGANVNAVNNTKVSPFIKALSSGKGINMDVIRLMEKKGLKITKELASDGLRGFICNKNIMVWELDQQFVDVADYLITLGAVVTCPSVNNPWELESTQRNMHTIIEATQCNRMMLKQLQKRKINVSSEVMTSEEMYNTIINASTNSFERTCLSLVSCSQSRAFLLLKACLQSGMQESLQFLTPPDGLMEFVQSEKDQIVVLRSFDMELTRTRLKNTIDPDLQVVRKDDLKRNMSVANLIMYVCETATNDEVRRLVALNQKTICVCSNVNKEIDGKRYKILIDKITWNDLATSFQNKLRLSMKVLSEIKATSNDKFMELQNEQLANFINENLTSELVNQIQNYATKHMDKTRLHSTILTNHITPLHLSVEAGHYAVTEYLLSLKEYYSKLDKYQYVMHCCVSQSNKDDEATISQKLKIIPLLTRINKKWVNDELGDGTTPLLQPNIHSKLFECLVKSGANANVINKDGVSPFIQIMTLGKPISIQAIKMMEKNGLNITKEIASQALTGVISNRNIMAWELDADFVLVADYLVEKGGVLLCQNDANPWQLESTQKNIELIAQFTQYNETFLQQLQKRDILPDLKKGMDNSAALYKRLEGYKNSFEKTIISLIGCNQIQPVLLLKQCIQSGNVSEESLKFVTFPKGLINFLKEQNNNVIVMRSWDTTLTVTRLRNTVDPDINVIEKQDINNEHQLSQSNMIVYICKIPVPEEISSIEKLNRKLIIVCSNIGKNTQKTYQVIDDEICWKDLSRNFQNEMDLIMRVQHEATGFSSNEICYILKNEELVSFITKQTKHSSEIFEIIENYKNENLKQNASLWLGNIIECKITSLHVAVQRGDLAISEYLLNWKNYLQIHNPEYLVHWCVRESIDHTEFILSQKIKIIQLLSINHKRALNEPLEDGTTPILQTNVHEKLLDSLIKFGADANAFNKHGCVLHRLSRNITPESYHDLLTSLLNQGFKQFNTTDFKQACPLHVAVTHVDLNPETIKLFHSNGANINASDESGDSILIYAIRSMRSITLIKTLVDLGADLAHTNHKHHGLIHNCEKYGNREAFEYLLMTHGIAPFIQGLQYGKGLLINVINFMQERRIEFNKTLATSALNALISNKYIMAQDLNQHYTAAIDYLIEKGGVFTCENGTSPWSLHATQKNLSRIVQATHYDDELLQQLQHRQVIPSATIGESRELYNELKESRKNTFERLCVSLICSNQINPFLILKQCVQSDMVNPAIFLTPPNKIVEFLNSSEDQVIILRTYDPKLSIKRLQDTIDPDLLIIEQGEQLQCDAEHLTIFMCENFTSETFKELKALGRKIVCLCKITVPVDGYQSVLDEICWEDFSTDFQDDMVSYQENEASDDQDLTSELKNESLIDFIRDNLPEFIGFHLEEDETLDDALHLSTDIFQYFLADKLVFQHITQNELQKYSTFGHNIGVMGDQDNKSLDYFLVNDYAQFEHIYSQIQKTSPNVHLIKHHEGKFKLLTTRGSNTEILRFINQNYEKRKEQECDNFPLCTCGNHPIGSGNLIWDIFRLPNTTSTCWIHVPEVLEQIKATTDSKSQGQIHQLSQNLKNMFQQQKYMVWWRNINKSIPGIELQEFSIGPVDVINILLSNIDNEENELTGLHNVAVNTLKLTKQIIPVHNDFKKYLDLKILAYNNDALVFEHEILAWYFIAHLVVGNTKLEVKDVIGSSILQDCIKCSTVAISFSWWADSKYGFDIPSFKFNNMRVFQFIDNIIKDGSTTTLKIHLNKLSTDMLVKWLFASVHGNLLHIFKMITSISLKLTQIELENLLVVAVKYGEVPLIKVVSEWVGTQTGKRVQDIELVLTRDTNKHPYNFVILHVAALRGNFSVMKYLLNNHGFKLMLNNPNLLDILRFCVCDSKSSNQILVNERKRIIDFLIQLDPNLIEETNKHVYTPLLVPNIHMFLITRLINLGISATSTDTLSNNILHLSPKYLNPQEYDQLVRLLHTKGYTELFHSQGEDLCTPLHKAVQYLEIQESTLDLFSSVNVDFNAVKDNGNTVLIYAVKHLRSARVLDALVRFGADVNMTGQFCRSVLHAAAEVGNLTAVRYLIYKGCDVNALDENNSTPLHLALELSKMHTHQILVTLVLNGGFVNAVNNYKRKPLWYAMTRKKLGDIDSQTVEFIKNAGKK